MLRKLFTRKKKLPARVNYPIELAFELDGVRYYKYVDPNNMPAGRMLAALKFYIPLQTNCDKVYLTALKDGLKEVLTDKEKISLDKAFKLIAHFEERLEWELTPEAVLQYASVVYMDENENPETYDDAYNEKKIERWKKHGEQYAFFLTEPITTLIPFLKSAGKSAPA